MVSLIILLPFFSFLSCSVGGGARFYSERGLQIFVSFLWVFIWSLIISLFSVSGNLGISYQILFLEWFKVFPLSISWSIEINKVTLTMLLLIITVSTLVHIFSLNYICSKPEHELPHQPEFLPSPRNITVTGQLVLKIETLVLKKTIQIYFFFTNDPRKIPEGEEASLPCRVKNLFQHYTVANLILMICPSVSIGGIVLWTRDTVNWSLTMKLLLWSVEIDILLLLLSRFPG